jgi:hypothetical protein
VQVSGGGSVGVVGEAEQGAIAVFATLSVSGGGGVRIRTTLPGNHHVILARILPDQAIRGVVVVGDVRATITTGGGPHGDLT